MARDPLANPEPLIRRVYAFVAYRVGAGADAEDITSEVMERALRYRDSFDPRRGEPAAWLIGIARRCIDDALARRPAHVAAPEDVAAPGDLESDAALRDELQRALRRLGDRDRELLALRFGADLSARQIGEELEMATNAVEVALHRALGRLRVLLDPPDEEAEASTARPVRI